MYKPEKRNIYRYWNGVKEVSADPMVLAQRMGKNAKSIEDDFKSLQLQNEASLEAFGRIATISRDILSLKEYSESDDGVSQGVTDQEAILIFTDFATYLDMLKKNMPSSQKSPITTEVQDSSTSSATTLTTNA